ncbi:GFA family protein [Rhodovibrio salinarum]|uniref:Aldehyde-activating protein n=1 Tax=Rhodovibrio salinarum TaxID=1087 RepID=A0A934UZL9_9PROT|nr:GFA family protein [Rhodovibrio salinarum]MBK1696656.1 aldehyde-activating protein [Rhodovibrio salinarum]
MTGGTGSHTGGCLCGQVRYRVDAPIGDVAHCHCTMCRRASGAVAVTWFTVQPDAFTLTTGQLRSWQSSPGATRGFCPGCGCQITFQTDAAAGELDVTLATLDDADRHPAQRHIWTDSRLSWLTLDPDLPESGQE